MIKKEHIHYHVLIWAFLVALSIFSNSQQADVVYMLFSLIFMGINIVTFYASYFFAIPYFTNQKKIFKGVIRAGILVIISVVVKFTFAMNYRDIIIPIEHEITNLQYLATTVFTSSAYVLLSYAMRLGVNSFELERMRKTLENEKLNAELSFLKSQINPHFLFNSLNNIYSLAYQKSDKAPEAILKLSEIMRYMLYESNVEKVALEDEINYLENYIELQKLRVKEHVFLELVVDVDNYQHRVMPLLLISFLENVFKHGITTDEQHPIKILIEVKNKRLHFKAQNKKSNLNKDRTGGVGMTNLKRRLELGYPDKHSLNVQDNGSYYSSELFVYL